MPGWQGSTRKETLPPDWKKRREERFRLDGYQCTATNAVTGERCDGPAEECDHHGDRLDHSIDNLRSLCSWHHGRKSAAQGLIAKANRLRRADSKFRRDERHPGLL